MIESLKDLYLILQPDQKKKLIQIQFFILCMAAAELLTVFSIVPFMAFVNDPSVIQSNVYLSSTISYFQLENSPDLVIYIGVGVILIILLASSVSIGTVWLINIFAAKIGFEISSSLYKNYMLQSWAFHSINHSSKLNNKIMNEASRLTSHVITPIFHINARAMVIFSIIIGITVVNPVIALSSFGIFSLIYFLIFKLIKKRLNANGIILTKEQESRIKLIHDGFGGIKDTLILGRQGNFIESFSNISNKVAIAGATNQALTQIPRYFLEFLAFTGLVLIVITFHLINSGSISDSIPTISLFAVAAFKILPSLQILFGSVSMIQGNISAVHSVMKDLQNNQNNYLAGKPQKNNSNIFKRSIQLKNITYTYPSKKIPAVDNISIEISKNSKVGIVGASGSGKSTLLDIILCLINPDAGKIFIDGMQLKPNEIQDFQSKIGFVPQTPFLADSSILSNIAFGLSRDEINMDLVMSALKLAKLEDFINSLPNGIDNLVGERGVQISGGQKQRISIARALYNDPSIIIFDEATSSLDGTTEANVMKEIDNLALERTIIIVAHRLSTVKSCKKIFFLSHGRLEDAGTYTELFDRNYKFREMALKS